MLTTLLIKAGSLCKPTLVKAHVSAFVSLSVKVVHLEPVSNLTSEAFIAVLRRFAARHGKPCHMERQWFKFVGAARDLKELFQFLCDSTDYFQLLFFQNIR